MQEVVLIVHNVRSTHNVGSLLRSADGFGISHVYLTGYTPYPKKDNDERLPHIADKLQRQINKTALGADKNIAWSQSDEIAQVINDLKTKGFLIAALEQTKIAADLGSFKSKGKIALIVGNEIDGIDAQTLGQADIHLQIPMRGKKESFNVAIAGSIALYKFASLDKDNSKG
jgi:23S rRNA (guanosine2251-2'-O)-methyltransferase